MHFSKTYSIKFGVNPTAFKDKLDTMVGFSSNQIGDEDYNQL
jgi:hypothetical protein